MADFEVEMYRSAQVWAKVKVEAESKEEAYEKAKDLWLNGHSDVDESVDADGEVWLFEVTQ